jgi:hypothetical protein
MGNLSSCCLPGEKNEERDSERTRILEDPNETYTGECMPGSLTGPGVSRHTNYGTEPTSNGVKEETSAWNRTLHKMANNVIDVSTMDVPSLEQSEWMERQRTYTSKINQTKAPLVARNRPPKSSHKRGDSHDAHKKSALSAEPISSQDMALINEFSDKSLAAVRKGFVVNVSEDLVVQFDP